MIKRGTVLVLAASALLGAGVAPAAVKPAAAKPAAAPAVRDWAQSVTMTPEGSYLLGNPLAKVRMVEYLSLTCNHCAHFTGESLKPLTDSYVRKGLVSIEVRHAIRDSLDVAATLLARCGGGKTFFGNMEALMAAQESWVGAAVAFQQKDQGAAGKLPLDQALAAFAKGAGLDRIMASRGLPAPRAAACLADKKEQDRLVAMAREAWSTRQIPGTPAFLINGTLVAGASSWAALEPKLQEALR
jgi:protein-disulfide isomerase